ncbi:MAG: hypothetical protein HYS98_04065 [Deltaproteobacteria bacterium]|nr:hypothetical protein [Deltaproteobacteria bacterium]
MMVACQKKKVEMQQPFIAFPAKISLKPRPLPKDHDRCHLCHLKKYKVFVPKPKKTSRNHQKLSLKHGTLDVSCNHCHDMNNSNYLRSTTYAPAGFENSSGVCKQCHVIKVRDWQKGLHGRRTGGWNRDKLQYQCVDCHNPHDVEFKKMQAIPHPNKPRHPKSILD